jgi:hypothetical protein
MHAISVLFLAEYQVADGKGPFLYVAVVVPPQTFQILGCVNTRNQAFFF